MRVRGDCKPNAVDVTAYEPIPGKAEVRVRENITPYSEIDPETGELENGYEYDEYIFIMDDAIGLVTTITNNIEDWLITGRTSEVAPNASLYVTAKMDAIDAYTAEDRKSVV